MVSFSYYQKIMLVLSGLTLEGHSKKRVRRETMRCEERLQEIKTLDNGTAKKHSGRDIDKRISVYGKEEECTICSFERIVRILRWCFSCSHKMQPH